MEIAESLEHLVGVYGGEDKDHGHDVDRGLFDVVGERILGQVTLKRLTPISLILIIVLNNK